jgi:hypothetical protein
MRILIAVLLLGTSLGACAAAGAGGARVDRNVMTLEQIEEADQTNLYDLVRVHRPHWLNTRGPNSFRSENPIMVYFDGTRIGDLEELRSLSPYDVREIRFLGAAQAQARYGLGNTRGAIDITSR